MAEIPPELLEDNPNEIELKARIGRLAILNEMGFFRLETNINLALAKGNGSWTAQVRKRFSGMYGSVAGCHPADIEVAAEMLDVFPEVFNVERYE